MSARRHIRRWAVKFLRDETGATLVEFAMVIALMLLFTFAIIDFGRYGYHYVMTEKAVENAVRIAAVRPVPAACAALPTVNERGDADLEESSFRFGTACGAEAGICAAPTSVTCEATNVAPEDGVPQDTGMEVWGMLAIALPPGTEMSSVVFSYDYDPNLGFLGGPYVPMVTVELQDVEFSFVTPLGQLAALAMRQAAGSDTGLGGTIDFGNLSASLPGEDLGHGS